MFLALLSLEDDDDDLRATRRGDIKSSSDSSGSREIDWEVFGDLFRWSSGLESQTQSQ